MPTIWLDADAAPGAVKEILFRAAARRGVDVVVVANRWQQTPKLNRIRMVVVESTPDAADDHIVEHCGAGDLVVSADVPLAARVIEKGAELLQPRGGVLDAQNIAERSSLRDFGHALRDAGVMTGGPSAFGGSERQAFANALDRWLTQQGQ